MAGIADYKRRQCAEKKRYKREEDARDVLRAMQVRRKPGYKKLHIYSCSFCGGWHVGKDAKRK